jgi:serine protease AprX
MRDMPVVRVTVNFANGYGSLLERVLENAVFDGGVANGFTDEQGVAQLRDAGLLVDVVPVLERPEAGTPTIPRRLSRFAALAAAVVPPAIEGPEEPLERPGEIGIYVVALAGPLFQDWLIALAKAGGWVLERRAPRTWTLMVAGGRSGAIAELPFVSGLRRYTAFDTVHPAQLALSEEAVTFEALVHPRASVDALAAQLADLGIEPLAVTSGSVRFRLSSFDERLLELARDQKIASLAEFGEPAPANDRARALAGIDPPSTATAALPWTGAGQIIAVADSGVDDAHPDLSGRLVGTYARARAGDHSDLSGHGTHVAATIAGIGDASTPKGAWRGIAPGAELVFQSIEDAGGSWTAGIGTIGGLLDEAYTAGARIHNNSWAVENNASAYPEYSRALDEFVHDHPDMLVVVAAGNSGSAAFPLTSPIGWVDVLSMGAPGTAKNALTVGACRSDRAPVGAPPQTFGARDAAAFPQPPVRDSALSGDAQSMAAFSSRGPCDDQRRIKPDLVAPGTYILSARASTATGPFWEPGPTADYVYDGGTSMAAPVVAGAAALVREYLVDDRGHKTPSAALLKAILINGAVPLTGADAVAGPPGDPNFHQGFGALSLRTSLPNDAQPDLALEFHDDPTAELIITGNGYRFDIAVADTLPLRICLAWTDPPGDRVQNAVALRVWHGASKGEWYGNQDRSQFLRTTLDPANNVQVVKIAAPAVGAYEIWVEASELTRNRQAFALVVTGALTSGLTIGHSY